MSSLRRRAAMTSVASTFVDAGLFSLLTLFLVGPALLVARWSCGALGAVTNFTLNRTFAFRVTHRPLGPQALRYGATALLAITTATLLWWGMRRFTGADPRILHLCSLALAWLLVTFPMLRGWVFRTDRCH